LDSKYENSLIQFIQDIPGHKYWKLLENNDNIIRALNDLFGHIGTNIGVISLQLNNQEKDIITYCADYLIDIDKYIKDVEDITEDVISRFTESIKILNKYNPRTDTKATQSEWDISQALLNRVIMSSQTGQFSIIQDTVTV